MVVMVMVMVMVRRRKMVGSHFRGEIAPPFAVWAQSFRMLLTCGKNHTMLD